MKAILTLVAVSAVFVVVLAIAPSAFASNGWGTEDPQVCVNGQLLSVSGQGVQDGSVTVPMRAFVDFAVQHCGGDPSLGVVPMNDVAYQGGNMLRISVDVVDGTVVTFSYGQQTVTDVAKHGSASAKFKTK